MGSWGWDKAGHYGFSIQENGTGAAFALGTTFLRADQADIFAQESQQGLLIP
jgi:hypothetical protein